MAPSALTTPYRALFAVVGWFALLLQYAMALNTLKAGIGEMTLNYFSYFTIVSNIMVTAALTLPVIAPRRAVSLWIQQPEIRSAIALYITVVGIAYHFLLAPTWNPQGWDLVTNSLLHYVMPTAFVMDWLLFTPKGHLTWSSPVKWLGVVLVYGAWTLLHGLVSHWWPYWFVNVDTLGPARAATYFTGLLFFFLMAGFVILALDHVLGQRDRRAAPT